MNILIVGLGSIAKKHIEALKQLEINYTLYALRSSISAQKEAGIINIFSIQEISSIKVDFAIVSNPTSEHKDSILSLLDLECPLFIEKPLYHTLEIEEVLIKAKVMDVLTYVACNLRFLDCLQFVKRNIDEGNLGKLNEVNVYCGSYLPEWRKSDYRKSYSAIPELGGGVHIDLIHELDYLYWIFGMPVSVNSIFKNVSSLGIEAFDYANYNLFYNSFCVNVILNYYRRDYKRTCELVFEKETWLVNLSTNTISSGSKIIFSSAQSIIETYLPQMKYFLELVILNNKQSFNTVYEAYDVLKICLMNAE